LGVLDIRFRQINLEALIGNAAVGLLRRSTRSMMMFLCWILILYGVVKSSASIIQDSLGKFKLSDLPTLKKWEIPMNRFSKHVGRKYKDLDNFDHKRSTYWELKPDFTVHELEWDSEPAKIQLDYNYKHFLEDDGDDDIINPKINNDKKNEIENNLASLKSTKIEKKSLVSKSQDTSSLESLTMDNKKNNNITNQTLVKLTKLNNVEMKTTKVKKLINVKSKDQRNKMSKKEKINKMKKNKRFSKLKHASSSRMRRSLEEDIMESPFSEKTDPLSESPFSDWDNREKRDTLGEIVKKAQLSALQKLDRIDLKLRKLTSKKDTIPGKKDTIPVKKDISPINKNTKNDIMASNKATSAINNKKTEVSVKQNTTTVLNKTKSNVKNQPTAATTAKRNDIPKAITKAGALGDEPSTEAKRSHIRSAISSILDSMKSHNSMIRNENPDHPINVKNEIGHPISVKNEINHPTKEKTNIDLVPSNVARAVAMAMEQLKRDKMWGKVFVHVRPSGQLKVMVQETKKMEEE